MEKILTVPPTPTAGSHASARDRLARYALLAAALAAALLAGDLSLITRSSAPSITETTAALALQGLSALAMLAALTLGLRALVVVGPDTRAAPHGGTCDGDRPRRVPRLAPRVLRHRPLRCTTELIYYHAVSRRGSDGLSAPRRSSTRGRNAAV